MFPQNLQIPHIKQIMEKQSFPERPVIFKTFYNYYRSGHLSEVIFEKYNEGKICETAKSSYRFYPEKNILESQELTEGGAVQGTEKIQYDAQGRKMKSTSYDASGEEFYRIEFTYDEQGRLTEMCHFTSSDENSSTVYSYNEIGQLVSDETRAFGHLIAGEVYTGGTSYKYNKKGQLLTQIALSRPSDRPEMQTTYEYNAKGNISKIQTYRFDGNSLVPQYTLEYSYLFY